MNPSDCLARLLCAAAALLAGCAASPQPHPDPAAPYQLRGATVARPAGDWRVAAYNPSTLVLRKAATAGSPSFVMGFTTISAAHLDLHTPDGQRKAVEGMLIAGQVTRYRIAELALAPERHAGAECVAYDAVVDERPEDAAAVPLILTNHGIICRHPDSLTYYVAGAYSERRSRDQRPLLDPPLRGEALEFLHSLRFTSL